MNKPYHERPDWILKSIVYFCDNYTIDGKDLRKYKRGAIKEYLHPTMRWSRLNDSIMQRLYWDKSPQGFDFWDCLWCLTTEENGPPDRQAMECESWTDYEKRKIAKLPRVK
jgi:hypothetical protein